MRLRVRAAEEALEDAALFAAGSEQLVYLAPALQERRTESRGVCVWGGCHAKTERACRSGALRECVADRGRRGVAVCGHIQLCVSAV